MPEAFAQKRVFATVDPNASLINRDANIYDPQTGTLAPVPDQMDMARQQHVAVRLGGGKVLVAGGYNGHYLTSAEIFDPEDGSFTATDEMGLPRSQAAAVLLRNGTVLVAGGFNGNSLNISEIYDPFSETFNFTLPMTVARQNPTVVLLNDGKALVIGGFGGTSGAEIFLGSAEIYNPSLRAYTGTVAMVEPRLGHTATVLFDGRVLVTGGCANSQTAVNVCDRFHASAEIYNPSEGSFAETGSMISARANHTATLLSDGRVLISGGENADSSLNSAEIFDPSTGVFTAVQNMGTPRVDHTASILPDGKVLIAGGYSDQHLASAEIFNPATGAFTNLTSSMSVPRLNHTATALNNGKVLLAGGQNSPLLIFDVNLSPSDNVSPNILISQDNNVGFVSYTGSGVIVAFSTESGAVIEKIVTGGNPAFITPLNDGQSAAVVSVLDNRVFIIDTANRSLKATYTFDASFGFGSIISLSPSGNYGYISSTATGEVIKFDVTTGNELGRLGNMEAPAQITVSEDGATLLIVDTSTTELVFANSSTMTVKYTMSPQLLYPESSFTIFNKPVLNLDETLGVVGSQDFNSSLNRGALIVFDPATGEIIAAPNVGIRPAFTTLLPTGAAWLVLCQNTLSTLSVDDLDTATNTPIPAQYPLGSANIVVSDDSRYAYYAIASQDEAYEHDLATQGVVGAFEVGDDPNLSSDQASSLAIVPDTGIMIVLNFASNQLDLLTATKVLRQTKFISENEEFTGLSFVNLSDSPAEVTVTAFSNTGSIFAKDGITNPATFWLEPNAQKAQDLSLLLNLDNEEGNVGHLTFESTEPLIAGYSTLGEISPDFLNPFLSTMRAFPLFPDYRESLHEWIFPEFPLTRDAFTEVSILNPNFNTTNYVVTHYGTDGTVLEESNNRSLSGSNRDERSLSDFVTSTDLGRVLVYGGESPPDTRNTGEIYDSITNLFITTNGVSSAPRHGHSASILPNEKILIAGGKNGFTILKSAELYDPVDRVFTKTPGSMVSERYRHTATSLPNGKVLLAGGQNSISISRTAEIYNPLNGSFESTSGSMMSPRDAHAATVLLSGKVLLTGGIDGIGLSATAEIFDPDTSTFSPTGSMNDARAFHTAVLLSNGTVLIAGGYNGSYLDSAEIYNPVSGTFTQIESMITARSHHTATLLSDGMVLIAGGMNSTGIINSAELYDPDAVSFIDTQNSMVAARRSHTATLLRDDLEGDNDKVLIAGGFGYSADSAEEPAALITAEVYNPQGREFSRTSLDMAESRMGHTATLLEGGKQGYLRGTSGEGVLATEIYSDGGASTSLNAINVEKFSGVTSIYSPLFMISPTFTTRINIINGNQESSTLVSLILHAPDGRILVSPKIRFLQSNAQLKGNLWEIFDYDTSLENQTGWLEIQSARDRLVGTLSFANPEREFLVTFQLSGVPMNKFVFPLVSEDADFTTSLSLLNTMDSQADVRLELWNLDGMMDASRAVLLNPGEHLSLSLMDLFPGMEPRRSANVRVYSDQPLHSMGTMSDRKARFVLSVPAVAIPEQENASAVQRTSRAPQGQTRTRELGDYMPQRGLGENIGGKTGSRLSTRSSE